jgi:molybdate transport system substrate-binding protein
MGGTGGTGRPGRPGCRAMTGAAGLAGATLLAAGCGSSGGGGSTASSPKGTVTVFAAASLEDAFNTMGKDFEKAHPGVTVKFNYAGSSSLATQINQDAPADLFASADEKNMSTVTSDHQSTGSPQVFVRNKLEMMVGAGNPERIKTVSDLSHKSVKVAVCAPAVPCGNYSREVFRKAGVTVHPVSEETSVSEVVTKVQLGEADAGVVYVTDVKAGGKKIAGVPIPANQNVVAKYPIVKLKNAPNPGGATAFMNYVLSSSGQQVLTKYGFLPPR